MCANHAVLDKNGWGRLNHGVHACSIFRDADEQFSQIAPFFSEGFKRHEGCVYVFDEHTPEEISSKILPEDTSDGAFTDLEILSQNETYTKESPFDPDNTISMFRNKISALLEEGYSGVRVAAEMTWVLKSGTPVGKLIEYEMKLNDFYPTQKLTGVCQYSEERFPPEFLINMIRTHPYLIIRGKLYENKYFYTSPKYAEESLNSFKSADYETILSMFTDEEPIG